MYMIRIQPDSIKMLMEHADDREQRVRLARVWLVLFAVDRYNENLIDNDEFTQYLDQAFGGDDATCLELVL